MKLLVFLLLGVVSLAVAGCRTATPGTPVQAGQAQIGRNVHQVVQASIGLRMDFFDSTGKQTEALPHGKTGSVSIYRRDNTGQDNYSFNADGVITAHKRSVDDNFVRGIWEAAP